MRTGDVRDVIDWSRVKSVVATPEGTRVTLDDGSTVGDTKMFQPLGECPGYGGADVRVPVFGPDCYGYPAYPPIYLPAYFPPPYAPVSPPVAPPVPPTPPVAVSMPVPNLARALQQRDLWDEHVQYTRMAIVAFAAGLPELDATLARLMMNQDSIGASFAEVFGADFGQRLAALLRAHIDGSVKLLKAAKAKSGVDEATRDWYANADEIAALLASTGRWPEAALRDLLHRHLDTTITEATAELGGQWAESVAAYDAVRAHALAMADVLARGMV